MTKKTPRWTIAFLRALERTGEVRAAAEDAGIDHSTAYARRRAHAEFAERWDEALWAHAARVKEEVLEEAPPPHFMRSPSPANAGEDVVSTGGQVKRAGHDRWSQAKEKLFFEELAATANVRRAAAAAGVSPNAVYARRMKHPLFKAKWAAVLESGRAAIEMKLVEAANKAFDPDEIDVEHAEPKVSVAEAIRIVQLHGTKKQQEHLPNPYAEEAASMTPDDVHELRERLVKKLQRMRRRDRPELLAQGWSYDEAYDRDIPPGWVRASS